MEPHGQMGWGMELHHPAPNWLYTASGHEIRKKCPQISTNLDHSVHVNPTEVPEMVTCILCSLNSPIYWTLQPMVWQLEQVWKPCFAGSYKGNLHQNRTWTRVPRLVPHLSLKNGDHQGWTHGLNLLPTNHYPPDAHTVQWVQPGPHRCGDFCSLPLAKDWHSSEPSSYICLARHDHFRMHLRWKLLSRTLPVRQLFNQIKADCVLWKNILAEISNLMLYVFSQLGSPEPIQTHLRWSQTNLCMLKTCYPSNTLGGYLSHKPDHICGCHHTCENVGSRGKWEHYAAYYFLQGWCMP